MSFFRKTIEDLRERRLWPVAAVLAVALVAVPVFLLSRGSESASTSTPVALPPAASSASSAAVTVVADSRQSLQARLKHFKAKDPFKPQGVNGGGSGSTDGSLGAAGAGNSSTGSDTAGGGSVNNDVQAGGTTSNGNGSTTGSDTPSGVVVYTVDVKIDSKTYKDVKPGKTLISTDNPLVVYAGTETGSKQRADFFLANGLSVQFGKGATYVAETDMLKLEENAVVYITTPDGKEYKLSVTAFGTTTVAQSGTSASAHR